MLNEYKELRRQSNWIIDLLAILKKESQSNDTLLHFVEFSNVHNSDRSFNATRSNFVYIQK